MTDVEAEPLHRQVPVRFTVSLIGTVLRAGLTFAASLVVARSLGPAEFGVLAFLLASFVGINKLVDLGTSTAFFTFISRRRRSALFYAAYGGWLVLQFLAVTLIVGLLLPASLRERLWVGEGRAMILLGFAAAFAMGQVWSATSAVGESTRRTASVHVRSLALAFAYLVGVAVAGALGYASVALVLGLTVLLYVGFAALFFLAHAGVAVGPPEPGETLASIAREFRVYAAPLVVSVACSSAWLFFDAWLLQRYGGASEQGLYAAAERVTAVSLLVTTSMTSIFWKELAEAEERRDTERARRLYHTTTLALFSVAAIFAAFLAPWSAEIVQLLLGGSFSSALPSFFVLAIVPVFQTLGQLNGIYLYAAGMTREYRNILIGTTALSLVVAYLLLAPPSAGGLGMGAFGLAIKALALTVLSVGVQSLVIGRRLGTRPALLRKATILAGLLVASFLLREAVVGILAAVWPRADPWVPLLLAGTIYGAMVGATALLLPRAFGIEEADVRRFVGSLRRAIRRPQGP